MQCRWAIGGGWTCGRLEAIRAAEERAILEYNAKKAADAQKLAAWRQAHFGGSATYMANSSDPGAPWGTFGPTHAMPSPQTWGTSRPQAPLLAITTDRGHGPEESVGSTGLRPHVMKAAPEASAGSAGSVGSVGSPGWHPHATRSAGWHPHATGSAGSAGSAGYPEDIIWL